MRPHIKYFRVSSEELAELHRRAGKMRLAPFVRACALGHPPIQIPQINQTALVELRKIGTNLNQIARRLNAESSTRELAKAADTEITALRNSLAVATLDHPDEATD